jgi:hypothetical protein
MLHEPLTSSTLAATGIILSGVALMITARGRTPAQTFASARATASSPTPHPPVMAEALFCDYP